MTFFAWPGAYRGRIGAPQVTTTAFAVPKGSLSFWSKRLGERSIPVTATAERFGERFIAFVDADGMQLELVESGHTDDRLWKGGGVPIEHAVRGFHSVTLSEEGYEHTARVLTDTMQFRATHSEGNRFRYEAAGAEASGVVDLLCVPDSRHGTLGAGIVHHVAFRTPDAAQQIEWRRTLVTAGLNVSPVMDRNYFHSIYYREPGGVLFEIATNSPGFAVDEPADQLGEKLQLPKQYEPMRAELEQILPPIKRPTM
jgi:glyoxalase family protein